MAEITHMDSTEANDAVIDFNAQPLPPDPVLMGEYTAPVTDEAQKTALLSSNDAGKMEATGELEIDFVDYQRLIAGAVQEAKEHITAAHRCLNTGNISGAQESIISVRKFKKILEDNAPNSREYDDLQRSLTALREKFDDVHQVIRNVECGDQVGRDIRALTALEDEQSPASPPAQAS